MSDLEFAQAVLVVGCEPLDDVPILDLRIRKGVRRRGVQLAVATARPSALDANAQVVTRYDPGGEAELLAGLAEQLASDNPSSRLGRLLRDGGEDVVIVWGERMSGPALRSLLRLASLLGLAERDGAGLLEIPAVANGRGLREVGVLPGAGPGYAESGGPGRAAHEIAQAAVDGELTALYLFETDPLRDQSDGPLWQRALDRAGLVVAHASVLTAGLEEHANVIFPADTYPEKEGTVVHPDGRLQRLRTAIGHPAEVRPGWWVVAEVAKSCGLDLGVLTSSMAFSQLVEAVPFYSGLTLEEIGGRGVRWWEREGASARFPSGSGRDMGDMDAQIPHASTAERNGGLRLGVYRPIWAAPEVEISPALKFAIAHQQAEISPEDAQRLGIVTGELLDVSQNGSSLRAKAAVRSGVAPGTVFLATGLTSESANLLSHGTDVEVRKA